jgi:hypothetical protein
MKESYDFSQTKRGAVVAAKGKTRITIWVDDAALDAFRKRAASLEDGPLTMTSLRRVIREELQAA